MRKFKNDRDIIQQLTGEDYNKWIVDLREILDQEDSPISFKNGIWKVKNRRKMWQDFGPYIFDEHLNMLRQIATEVLKEPDPQFELKPDERYMAKVHGKDLRYSEDLRKGLAETLALLGTQAGALNKCPYKKVESTAAIAIREIFKDSDFILWGSLNPLLPTLAEAAPEQFLTATENAVNKTQCPFDELFSQEGIGIAGKNYMTGLLWALETLAWSEEYLVRTTIALGKLAVRDPGGNWGNRPSSSLTTIFLPWMPQTIASIEKRKVAIQTLLKELPEVGWQLLLSLLPNQCRSSSGSHKPEWRKFIPDDWEKGVTNGEYWEQTVNYSEMAIETAKNDITKLKKLVAHLQNLPEPSFDALLAYLETEKIRKLPEEERIDLWDVLNRIIIRQKWHHRAGEKGSFTPETVHKIEQIAEILRPESPHYRYRYLFSNRDIELYEERGNYEEQENKLEKQRQNAIKEILQENGVEGVLQFFRNVNASRSVGYSLGIVSDNDIDAVILPDLIEDEEGKIKEFTSAFVFSKHNKRGWEWINQLDTKKWTKEQIGIFLSYLPSTQKTWVFVTEYLHEHEVEYWKRAGVYPYDEESDWDYAIKKLIQYKRPNAAIKCLNGVLHRQKKLNTQLAIDALINAVSSEETLQEFDSYNAVEIIKALQDSSKVDPDDLFRVEWAYVPLLTGPGKSAGARFLEQMLADNSVFFCQLIQSIYRSKNEPESSKESTKQEKSIATNAFHLLHDWKKIPGMDSEGHFSSEKFTGWLEEVKSKCNESGHYDVAMITLGEVLVHSPADTDGLWIHKTIAEALNGADSESLRRGYYTGVINSRGAHWVDPTGQPEKDLAAKYRQQAEEVENSGFYLFATTLRDLARNYDEQAKHIIEEHKEK